MIERDGLIRAAARLMASAGLALSACSGGAGDGSTGAPVGHVTTLSGKAMGGQQPLVGSAITLYAAGTSGYGAGDSVLGTATTQSDGTWTVALASCPVDDPQLYLVALGGAAVSGSPNSAIGLSTALGACSAINGDSAINIDEVSTVASAYALAQFLDSSGQHLGTSATNPTGLANAAANVAMLADVHSGQAQTVLPAGSLGTLPAATLNTLANILSACVNTTVPSSSQCTTLLGSGGASASNTLQAALNIARNPGTNVAALFGLATANAPFQNPTPLGTAPGDWTLAVSFSGNGLVQSNDLSIDGAGIVWVANRSSAAVVNGSHGSISAFLNDGAPLAGSPFVVTGLSQPQLLDIDAAGHVWVADINSNRGRGSVYELASGGSELSGPYTASISAPGKMAIDLPGNIWVMNGNGALVKLAVGNNYASTSFPLSLGDSVSAIATDAAGRVWLSLFSSSRVAAVDSTGAALSGSPFSGGGMLNPVSLAADAAGMWVASQSSAAGVNNRQGSLTRLDPAGTAATGSPFVAAGMNGPLQNAVAVDGRGRVWVANIDGSVSELNNDGSAASPAALAQDAGAGQPAGLAIDSSGSIWLVNNAGAGTLTKLIGLATPVKTPVVAAATLP